MKQRVCRLQVAGIYINETILICRTMTMGYVTIYIDCICGTLLHCKCKWYGIARCILHAVIYNNFSVSRSHVVK